MVVCPRALPLEFQRSLSVLAAETEESVRSQVAETRNGTLRKPSRSRIASRRGHGPTGTLLGALYAKPLGFETCWSSRSRRHRRRQPGRHGTRRRAVHPVKIPRPSLAPFARSATNGIRRCDLRAPTNCCCMTRGFGQDRAENSMEIVTSARFIEPCWSAF
jgi:hypothetical protein